MISSAFAARHGNPDVLSLADSYRAIWWRLIRPVNHSEISRSRSGVRLSNGDICLRLVTCRYLGVTHKFTSGGTGGMNTLHIADADSVAFGAFLPHSINPPHDAPRPNSVIVSADGTSWWIANQAFLESQYHLQDVELPESMPGNCKGWLSWDDVSSLAKTQLKSFEPNPSTQSESDALVDPSPISDIEQTQQDYDDYFNMDDVGADFEIQGWDTY